MSNKKMPHPSLPRTSTTADTSTNFKTKKIAGLECSHPMLLQRKLQEEEKQLLDNKAILEDAKDKIQGEVNSLTRAITQLTQQIEAKQAQGNPDGTLKPFNPDTPGLVGHSLNTPLGLSTPAGLMAPSPTPALATPTPVPPKKPEECTQPEQTAKPQESEEQAGKEQPPKITTGTQPAETTEMVTEG
eukprot:TRINITY_DN66677_c2_g3_i2.p2 TRINITY_DN66677_c2_g3~~TRINITY_DN66677_c2_g3_i2.p2  ORF type:complete len:187 (-),score=26.98 TRINITY_DN66677_c2_g3_i2:81-641(-)